jgi:AcrR family transcriptional regulator
MCNPGGENVSRKATERETRRRYVVDAARELFARKGVEATSMEDIARAVEYTRRTLYAYFPGREEIQLLVLVDDLKARWASQRRALDEAAAATGLDRILLWGRSFYAYAKANSHTLRLHLHFDLVGIDRERVTERTFAEFESLNAELADGLRRIFAEGVRDGSLDPALDVDMCISQYLYSLRGIVNRALSPGYSFAAFDADAYVGHYLDLFARGIRMTGGTDK